jgi:hypothetical protein
MQVKQWIWYQAGYGHFNELAWYYYRIRMPDKTEQILEQAYLLDTNSVVAWYLKGTFYGNVRQNKKAEYWFFKSDRCP